MEFVVKVLLAPTVFQLKSISFYILVDDTRFKNGFKNKITRNSSSSLPLRSSIFSTSTSGRIMPESYILTC